MKRYIIALLLLAACTGIQAQSWSTYNTINPGYSFQMPGNPVILDTLNIRYAYLKQDSITVFQVMAFKDTPLDSANSAFIYALGQTSGDTLMALASSIAATNGAIITGSQNITDFSAYKGLEACMKYNDPIAGRILVVYTRYYYNDRLLLTFSVTGAEDDMTVLQNNKTLFFNSISL